MTRVEILQSSQSNEWFTPLVFPIGFTDHRIKVETVTGKKTQPAHGNAFTDLGCAPDKFEQVFRRFGRCVRIQQIGGLNMVCSPEQARLNGAKSKGATTERGKAIAARNATQHGLLAKQPPLLVTEDLATFEGLVQGLINQYQPENPVEHFLVQQVAMGMLKQYRLWTVEAAIANLEILRAQQQIRFPDRVVPPKIKLSELNDFEETRTPQKTILLQEREVLQGLITDLNDDCSQIQDQGEVKTLAAFENSISENYYHECRTASVWQYQDQLDEWICASWNGTKKRYMADFQEAIARVQRLLELAHQRIAELDHKLGEIATAEQAIQCAQIDSNGMHQQELFSRYQRNINRELYEALAQLEQMRQRRNAGSMGSFGQKSDLSPPVQINSVLTQ